MSCNICDGGKTPIAFFCFLILLQYPSLSFSSNSISQITDEIVLLCKDKSVILLGETHQEPNSQKMFLALVQHYASKGDRTFVGLEIPADKQTELNKTVAGDSSNFSYIYPVMDFSAYRDILQALGSIRGDVTIRAIDARDDEKSREIAMKRNLQYAITSGDYDRVIVLVGNVHVIKKIEWHAELGADYDNK